MAIRKHAFGAALALVCFVSAAPAASHRTANFVVKAPTPELAREFGQLAEHYRKQKAIEWLGQEMPRWPEPCPLTVTVAMDGARGATRFNFMGQSYTQDMEISGPLERLRHSVLPHEITHTVFAFHFRQPVPRWADEGGSVLSEDDVERQRHDAMCRQYLNAGRGYQLRVLFTLKDYPRDMTGVHVLYAEGYSISRYLVEQRDRRTFLAFVGHGMQYGWDTAVQQFYGHDSVAALEKAWLDALRDPTSIARNAAAPKGSSGAAGTAVASGDLTGRPVLRSSAPPALPELGPPIVARGASPEHADAGRGWGTSAGPAVALQEPRPASSRDAAPFGPTGGSLTPGRPAQPTSAARATQPLPPPPPVVLFPPEPIR